MVLIRRDGEPDACVCRGLDKFKHSWTEWNRSALELLPADRRLTPIDGGYELGQIIGTLPMRELDADELVHHIATAASLQQFAVENATPPPVDKSVCERGVECFATHLVRFSQHTVHTKYYGFEHRHTLWLSFHEAQGAISRTTPAPCWSPRTDPCCEV
jgi:hypothetical protein